MTDLERLNRLLDAAQAHQGQPARPALAPHLASAHEDERLQVQATLAELTGTPVNLHWLAQVLSPMPEFHSEGLTPVHVIRDEPGATGLRSMLRSTWGALCRRPPMINERAFRRWGRWGGWGAGGAMVTMGISMWLLEGWLKPALMKSLTDIGEQVTRLSALPDGPTHAAAVQQALPILFQASHHGKVLLWSQLAVIGVSSLLVAVGYGMFLVTRFYESCGPRYIARRQARWKASPTVQAYLATRPKAPFRVIEVAHLDRLTRKDAIAAAPSTSQKMTWSR